MNRDELLADLRKREEDFWHMAQTFVNNRDAHGTHDAGVEIQAIERARKEVEKL